MTKYFSYVSVRWVYEIPFGHGFCPHPGFCSAQPPPRITRSSRREIVSKNSVRIARSHKQLDVELFYVETTSSSPQSQVKCSWLNILIHPSFALAVSNHTPRSSHGVPTGPRSAETRGGRVHKEANRPG